MNDERKSKTKSKIKRNHKKHQKRPNDPCGTNTLASSATPKGLKSHRKRKIWGKKEKFMAQACKAANLLMM